ncbi:MAG: phosphoribosylanthranilate isomerase [Synergistaceae bacterium]|nr:phosphoribosylanthranilate isomerase [Synergistaceae bacterium]
MTFVKVCGITREEDMADAVEFGVSVLGFILVPGSPRTLSLEKAAFLGKLVPPPVCRVAVMKNPSVDEIARVERSGAFDCIQFHGSEEPVLLRNCSLRTIKAFSIEGVGDLERASAYEGGNMLLLDSKKMNLEKGHTFDHSLLKKRAFRRPFFLAGGLGPSNLREALEKARPFGVDLNSGVESAPGIKDRTQLAAALEAVREFDDFERRRH